MAYRYSLRQYHLVLPPIHISLILHQVCGILLPFTNAVLISVFIYHCVLKF